jgi:cysteine-rich repeat protein
VDNDSLPDQVRKIEAFSYSLTNAESSAPVIYTQLPLSPPTPAIIEDVAIYNAVTTATCGDGVIQAGEFCDDGNTNPNDGCTNNCESPICSLNAGESGTNNDYISDIFYAPVDFDLHFGFNSQYYSDRLMIEISDSSSFTNTQVLYDSGCHSSDVAAFNLPGISRGRKQACGEGSRWDGNTLPFTIPRDKYFRVIVMNGVDWCGQPSTAWSLSIRCEQVSLFASSCCPVCTGGCEGC